MSQYQSGADGCSDYGADGALRGLKMKGGGGGKKKGGGGNMNFKRVVPSFLAGYTQMLTGKAGLPRGSGADDEDGPTRVSAAEAAGKFGGGSGGEDEEGAAVGEEEEAFQRAALERAQAEHGAAQAVASAQSDKRVQKLLRQKERARVEAMRAAREAADAAEAASGKHTFRSAPKRPNERQAANSMASSKRYSQPRRAGSVPWLSPPGPAPAATPRALAAAQPTADLKYTAYLAVGPSAPGRSCSR